MSVVIIRVSTSEHSVALFPPPVDIYACSMSRPPAELSRYSKVGDPHFKP